MGFFLIFFFNYNINKMYYFEDSWVYQFDLRLWITNCLVKCDAKQHITQKVMNTVEIILVHIIYIQDTATDTPREVEVALVLWPL